MGRLVEGVRIRALSNPRFLPIRTSISHLNYAKQCGLTRSTDDLPLLEISVPLREASPLSIAHEKHIPSFRFRLSSTRGLNDRSLEGGKRHDRGFVTRSARANPY